ncbi:MAG TPA: DNA polymerase III subunit delta [Coriobacteriia bacterium]|nr:DNA polymerase III subunit delta [Coriobacteriia bacterium]
MSAETSPSLAPPAHTQPGAVAEIIPPFDTLTGQPLVARFLSSAVENHKTSHAYLFIGPIGAGKNEAAAALAKALICRNGGCGKCDDCIRAARKTHPDIKIVDPEGAQGYVAEQIRELIHDTNLAPIQAQNKVYIITRADQLSGAPANAFLKTLEEPPARVIFILLARTKDSVLDTIISRCQVIVFRAIPEVEAVTLLMDHSRVTLKEARIALASTGGSAYKAKGFLVSSAARTLRIKVMEAIEQLGDADPLEIITLARDLLIYLKQPLDEVKVEQEKQLAEGGEFLSKGALSALERSQKRQLTMRERETLGEVFNVMRSWLRDCLALKVGRTDDVVNVDFLYNIEKTAANTTEAALVRSILAVDEAEVQIQYNVSVQSAIEALLFKIRKELVRYV